MAEAAAVATAPSTSTVLWVFGYASLLWKAGFEYSERRLGYIKGYRRALHMACFEHRGTRQHPARVATLEEAEEGALCWGYAYAIKDSDVEATLAYLRERENEYDDTASLPFFVSASSSTSSRHAPSDITNASSYPSSMIHNNSPLIPAPAASSSTVSCPDAQQQLLIRVIVFKSTPDPSLNKYYLGPAPAHDIALQIARARGPCGTNSEYLFRLEAALHSIAHPDPHITLLAHLVRGILLMDTLQYTVHRGLPQQHINNAAACNTAMAAADATPLISAATVSNTGRDVGSTTTISRMLTFSPSFPVNDRRHLSTTMAKPQILPTIAN